MPDTPSNQTLYAILIRIEKKVDKTNGSVAKNKATINKIIGGLLVVSSLVVPLAVWAIQNLLD
jgi:hypothetical protein